MPLLSVLVGKMKSVKAHFNIVCNYTKSIPRCPKPTPTAYGRHAKNARLRTIFAHMRVHDADKRPRGIFAAPVRARLRATCKIAVLLPLLAVRLFARACAPPARTRAPASFLPRYPARKCASASFLPRRTARKCASFSRKCARGNTPPSTPVTYCICNGKRYERVATEPVRRG